MNFHYRADNYEYEIEVQPGQTGLGLNYFRATVKRLAVRKETGGALIDQDLSLFCPVDLETEIEARDRLSARVRIWLQGRGYI